MTRYPRLAIVLLIFSTMMALSLPQLSSGQTTDIIELLPGTAILLDQSSGGGSGGSATSTSSSTNIFSPAAFVDYKRIGGEPTVVVDRYPFAPGQFGCPNTATSPCPPRDIVYVSAPQGFLFPHYSNFFKSDDLGQTFRVPHHIPTTAFGTTQGGGGGDSHQVVGAVSHRV